MIAPSLFYPSRFAAVSRLIPALSAGAQQDLSSVPLRMTDVPVVTAARLKGHAADGYALLRQHIQIAPACNPPPKGFGSPWGNIAPPPSSSMAPPPVSGYKYLIT